MRVPIQQKWWILAAMTGTTAMVFLDQSIVNVALPTMREHLQLSTTGVGWVVNAYLLAIASCVAAGGRLCDLVGSKQIFQTGMLLFTAASILCGLAQTQSWLIFARALQGIGSAMMIPASVAIITSTFPFQQRGRAFGIYIGISSIFLSLGPFLGGVLTEFANWRWIFFINVPIAIWTLAATSVVLPADKKPYTKKQIDLVGLVLLSSGLCALVLALMEGSNWGFTSTGILWLFAISILMLATFVWHERRAKEPLFATGLFRNSIFVAANIALFCVQAGMMVTLFWSILLQDAYGFSAYYAGLAIIPCTLPILFLAPIAGRVFDAKGPRVICTLGLFVAGLGVWWVSYFAPSGSYVTLLPGMICFGISLPFVNGPAANTAISCVPASQYGQASGISQTVRQFGGALGLAIMGAVINPSLMQNNPDPIAQSVSNGMLVGVGFLFFGALVSAIWMLNPAHLDHIKNQPDQFAV